MAAPRRPGRLRAHGSRERRLQGKRATDLGLERTGLYIVQFLFVVTIVCLVPSRLL